MSLCNRKKKRFRRGRCPQRPAITDAPPERADEDIGPYAFCRWGKVARKARRMWNAEGLGAESSKVGSSFGSLV